jgi:hypothetical protein
VLVRPNISCKLQTQPLVRESVLHQKRWSWAQDGYLTPGQTGQLTVSHNITLKLGTLVSYLVWGFNCASLFQGDVGTWCSRFGESQIWDSKMWSWILWDLDLRVTALAKFTNTNPSIRESCMTAVQISSWVLDGTGFLHQDQLASWPLVALWLLLWVQ